MKLFAYVSKLNKYCRVSLTWIRDEGVSFKELISQLQLRNAGV